MSDSNSNIDILKTIAPYIAALEPDDGKADILVKEFQKDIDRLETSYSEVAQDKSRQDETKRLQEALAKGLPAIANGIRDAVKAFQNNDPFAGSAAIIDIAASLSTTIGAMAGTAGGPPGALIGGILSIFSMILKLFSKKAPAKSLETQLLEVIRKYDAEKSLQGLKAAQIGLRAFVDDVDGGSQDRTELEIRELIKTHVGDILHNLTLGGEWLKEPKNQELEEWGLVLAAHCYTYIIYVHCVGMSLKAVATNRDMTNLMSTVYAEHSVQLRFLEEIVPAARRQGLLWVRASDEWWPRRFKVRRAAIPKAKWNDLVESGDHRSFNLLTVTTRTVNAETSDQTNPNLAFFGYVPSAYEKSPPDDSYTLEQAETELDHPFGKILKVASSGQLMGSFGQFPLDQNAQKIGLSPASPGVLISPEIGRTHTNLPDCHDFWATPGFLKGEVNLYATYGSTFLLWRQGSQDHPPGEDPLLYVNG